MRGYPVADVLFVEARGEVHYEGVDDPARIDFGDVDVVIYDLE